MATRAMPMHTVFARDGVIHTQKVAKQRKEVDREATGARDGDASPKGKECQR